MSEPVMLDYVEEYFMRNVTACLRKAQDLPLWRYEKAFRFARGIFQLTHNIKDDAWPAYEALLRNKYPHKGA